MFAHSRPLLRFPTTHVLVPSRLPQTPFAIRVLTAAVLVVAAACLIEVYRQRTVEAAQAAYAAPRSELIKHARNASSDKVATNQRPDRHTSWERTGGTKSRVSSVRSSHAGENSENMPTGGVDGQHGVESARATGLDASLQQLAGLLGEAHPVLREKVRNPLGEPTELCVRPHPSNLLFIRPVLSHPSFTLPHLPTMLFGRRSRGSPLSPAVSPTTSSMASISRMEPLPCTSDRRFSVRSPRDLASRSLSSLSVSYASLRCAARCYCPAAADVACTTGSALIMPPDASSDLFIRPHRPSSVAYVESRRSEGSDIEVGWCAALPDRRRKQGLPAASAHVGGFVHN